MFIASAATLVREAGVARQGMYAARISSAVPNDASFVQTITLEPHRNYLLSAWVRTENVSHSAEVVDAGVNLCLFGTWTHSPGLYGTNDWTRLHLAFNSGASGVVTVGARLGYWAGTASGTAWFDDLRVTEIPTDGPHPRWKILTLIYDGTDFSFTDASGPHHVVGHIDAAQVATAAANATRFVNTDIPVLDSGNMIPELTIRYPVVLTHLSPNGEGWWPSPSDTGAQRDPAFDSVVVIWQPTVTDQSTGESRWIGSAAGLTPDMGAGQAYTSLIIEAATQYGHLNVFKHEWGHSILSYFNTTGTAPVPTVSNHTDAGTYVHCGTGQFYVWEDETDAHLIPNSTYNDQSGFTHDYYSGTTALASDPQTCLGITAVAWATGGPVSAPGDTDSPSPLESIQLLRTELRQLVDSGALRFGWSSPLAEQLEHAIRDLADNDIRMVTKRLGMFRDKVIALRDKGRLPAAAANLFVTQVDALVSELLNVR